MRPIDADELIDCIRDDLYDKSGYWYKMIADALIKVINNMPTIKTDPEPAPIRLGSDANGCWIKCKDCENTRCSRRVVEDPPDPSVYDDSHLDQIVDDMLQ